MGINKVQYGNTTLIDLTSDTVTADKLMQGYTAHDRTGALITGTATGGGSGGNVWQDAQGYVHLDDEGTTPITVESLSVTQNGTYTAPTGKAYSPVTVNVSGGGGNTSSYELVGSDEVTISTSSSTFTYYLDIIPTKSVHTADKIVYVKVRDKAGMRAGYAYGSDTFFIDLRVMNGNTPSLINIAPRMIYACDSSLKFINVNSANSVGTGTTANGVYAGALAASGAVRIGAKYSSNTTTGSGIIDGTFSVEVYLLSWPNDISPKDEGTQL